MLVKGVAPRVPHEYNGGMSFYAPNLLIDQVAVVTGSSSGVGRAIALALATAGADVIVHAKRNAAGANEVAAQIEQLGRRAEIIMCDLSDLKQHAGLVANAWSWQRKVDIWINNAGGDVLTGEKADWSYDDKLNYLWQTDVVATTRLCRLVGPMMRERGHGVILNMGWDQAEVGMAGDAGEMFSTVKGAISAFTRSLAKTLAPQIRVHCLAPGWIKTAWGESADNYWQHRAQQESRMGRWGTPEDVAHAACFLASPAAAFLSGLVLPINGGLKQSE